MSEFFVDTTGIDGLYNQLVRASGDARETLAYTKKHCDIPFPDKGLLLNLLGPHRHAYPRVVDALDTIAGLTRDTATQINQAQVEYARTDADAAARVDAGYPGAANLADTFSVLSRGRPDLYANPSGFTDVSEPTRSLTGPAYITGVEMFELNPLADLISPAAWLRQIAVWLFDHDPLEAWGQAFSGDWRAYQHCAAAWGAIGRASADIGTNLLAGAADVSTVWRGRAAEAEQEFHLLLARAATALEPVTIEYSKLYGQAAQAAKDLYNVVTGLITKLIDVLILINIASAAGTLLIETGVGAVAGYGIAAYYAWQAYDLYNEISAFFGNAEALIKGIGGSITAVKAALDVSTIPAIAPYRHPAGY